MLELARAQSSTGGLAAARRRSRAEQRLRRSMRIWRWSGSSIWRRTVGRTTATRVQGRRCGRGHAPPLLLPRRRQGRHRRRPPCRSSARRRRRRTRRRRSPQAQRRCRQRTEPSRPRTRRWSPPPARHLPRQSWGTLGISGRRGTLAQTVDRRSRRRQRRRPRRLRRLPCRHALPPATCQRPHRHRH